MLISDKTIVVWNARNKKHYTDLGYMFTQMGNPFEVKIEDLTKGSQSVIKVKCDYCGKEYDVSWCTYLYMHRKTNIQKDACRDCLQSKASESVTKKYGTHSNMFTATNAKRINTNNEKYGCSNPFANEEIKDKIKYTNIQKYGVPYSQQSYLVREKTKHTCHEKYGVNNYVELFKGKFIKENSPVWKGGVLSGRTERATYEYSKWRGSVFDRDCYCCQRCGARNGDGYRVELHAHHIQNWADNISDRYDINNGITLCDNCHYEFHSIYGKHNNNSQQLHQFLNLDKKIC